MPTKVQDVMRTEVTTVAPDWPLIELERVLTSARIGGAPVVEHGRLVGVITHSDIVRHEALARSLAEYVSDWYYEPGRHEERIETIDALAKGPLEAKRVRDVMTTTKLWTIAPDATVAEAARTMVEHRVHRLPVTTGERLVGIVTTMDLLPILAAQADA